MCTQFSNAKAAGTDEGEGEAVRVSEAVLVRETEGEPVLLGVSELLGDSPRFTEATGKALTETEARIRAEAMVHSPVGPGVGFNS